jgi:hypothetical protein
VSGGAIKQELGAIGGGGPMAMLNQIMQTVQQMQPG